MVIETSHQNQNVMDDQRKSKRYRRYLTVLKYEHGKMIRCLFLEGTWTCNDCDMRKAGVCTEAFYKKHGYFEGEIDGSN